MPFMEASADNFVDLTPEEMNVDSILPQRSCSFILPKNYQDSVYTVRLLYPEYVPLTKREIRKYKELTGGQDAPATPVIEYVYARERTQSQLCAYFTPIIKQGKRYYYVSSYMPRLQATSRESSE